MQPGRGVLLGAGSVAISLAFLLVLPGVAGASRRASSKPAILSLKVTHSAKTLPAKGLGVKVTVRVRNAKRCVFFRQPKPRARLKAFKTVSCEQGHASVRIPRIPNPYPGRVRLSFAVKAIGAHGGVARRTVRLTEAAAAAQPTAALASSQPYVWWTGGTVTLTYSSTNATSCSLTASPTLWSGSNPLPVACNGSTPVTVPSSFSAGQWSVTFTATGAGGQKTASTTVSRQAVPAYSPSSNWSGYIVPSSGVITETSGRFTVPTLDCSQTPSASESAWVGLGGVLQSDDLLQTGVESDCSGGVQVDNPAWWEEFPEYYSVSFDSMTVSPGDQIEASVYEQGDGSWVTRVDDLTRGVSGWMIMSGGNVDFGTRLDSSPGSWYVEEGYGTGFYFAGASTAEWIVEDFDDCSSGSCVPVPFADFGRIAFEDLSVDGSTPVPSAADAAGIVQNGVPLAVPTPLSSSGFSVVYTG